jgi:hypothetical protein
MNTDEITKMA